MQNLRFTRLPKSFKPVAIAAASLTALLLVLGTGPANGASRTPGAAGVQRGHAAGHALALAGLNPRRSVYAHHRGGHRHHHPSVGTPAPAPAPEPTPEPTPTPAPEATPTPTPEPTPSPSPSPSTDLLFKGMRIRDYQLNQSAPGAVSEVADPAGSAEGVFRMTVANSDVYPVTPTSDPRAQLLSPSIIKPGDEYWWNSKFYLPADFPASVPSWFTVMEGPYGPPFAGTPPWHIEVNGSNLRWSRNDTYGWDVPWQMPLVRGRWVHVLVHGRFAADGFVEMWVDGQRVTFFGGATYNPSHEAATQHLAMKTLDRSNNGGANFTVIQSYRKAGMFGSVTLYQGPMALGRTRAAVE